MIKNIHIYKNGNDYQVRIDFDDDLIAYKEERNYLSLLKWLRSFLKTEMKAEKRIMNGKHLH